MVDHAFEQFTGSEAGVLDHLRREGAAVLGTRPREPSDVLAIGFAVPEPWSVQLAQVAQDVAAVIPGTAARPGGALLVPAGSVSLPEGQQSAAWVQLPTLFRLLAQAVTGKAATMWPVPSIAFSQIVAGEGVCYAWPTYDVSLYRIATTAAGALLNPRSPFKTMFEPFWGLAPAVAMFAETVDAELIGGSLGNVLSRSRAQLRALPVSSVVEMRVQRERWHGGRLTVDVLARFDLLVRR